MSGARWDNESESLLINLADSDTLYAEVKPSYHTLNFWTYSHVRLPITTGLAERKVHRKHAMTLTASGGVLLLRALPRLIAAARMSGKQQRQHRG